LSTELTDAAASKFTTIDALFDPVQVEEHLKLWKDGKGIFTLGMIGVAMNSLSKASACAKEIEATAPKTGATPGLTEQRAIQHRRLAEDAPALEVVSLPGFYSFPSTFRRFMDVLRRSEKADAGYRAPNSRQETPDTLCNP
jgi:hypothetical protein